MMITDWNRLEHEIDGTRALILGLAREGTALARFLAEHGARVTVTDVKPAEALSERLSALAGLPVRVALGGHPESLLDECDVIFVSFSYQWSIALYSYFKTHTATKI